MTHYQIYSLLISSLLVSPLATAGGVGKDDALLAAYNWSGFYIGANAGLIKHTMNITDNQANTFNATIEQTTNPKFGAGLQVGYRRQLAPMPTSGVFGLELSTVFTDASFNKEYGSPYALYQLSSYHKLKNTTLVQLIGGIAADRTYVFLAAGLAWTDVSGATINTDGVPFFNAFDVSKKQWGTALGCGIEYGLSEHLSARFKVDVIAGDAYSVWDNSANSYQVNNHIVQGTLGINYKFY